MKAVGLQLQPPSFCRILGPPGSLWGGVHACACVYVRPCVCARTSACVLYVCGFEVIIYINLELC